jgi:hypothetical protein
MMTAGTAQPVRYLPFALSLYYLLFAYSETSYIEEQEAMSVAMRLLHDQPIVRSEPGAAVPWELTLTLEHRSYDELSLLWQATTSPLRLSLVYRAAVVFLDADKMPAPAPDTSSFTVGVGQLGAAAQQAGAPQLLGSMRQVSFTGPGSVPVSYEESPASAAPGQTLLLLGEGLGGQATDTVFLLVGPDEDETDVTAWTVVASSTSSQVALELPASFGNPPAQCPVPGRYQLRVGHGALGSAGSLRSDAVPLGVAALVAATGGPVLSGTPPYTVQGAGFAAASCQVLVGAVPLAQVASSPGEGEVSIDPSGTSFSFVPPSGSAGQVAPVRVLVAGVESDPALWVVL